MSSPKPLEAFQTAWQSIVVDVRSGKMDGTGAVERIGYLISRTDDPDILRFLELVREQITRAWKEAQ